MEAETGLDLRNADGPSGSDSTGDGRSGTAVVGTEEEVVVVATTAVVVVGEVTMEDDEGEIVDDSDDDSSHPLTRPSEDDGVASERDPEPDAFREGADPLARKMNALEKLKSMKFGAGKNPYSMPVSALEERRRSSPPPPSMFEQKASKRKNMNDWDRPVSPSGRPMHPDMGRRVPDVQGDRPYQQQYDR